jgi:hypothetical protein
MVESNRFGPPGSEAVRGEAPIGEAYWIRDAWRCTEDPDCTLKPQPTSKLFWCQAGEHYVAQVTK